MAEDATMASLSNVDLTGLLEPHELAVADTQATDPGNPLPEPSGLGAPVDPEEVTLATSELTQAPDSPCRSNLHFGPMIRPTLRSPDRPFVSTSMVLPSCLKSSGL